MEIKYSNNIEEIKKLVKKGYYPVECSIGGKSIVDKLKMDHHEEWSYLEPVALRAYRDQYGARKNDLRFVSCGTADADACFAIAALAGIVPPKKFLPLAKTIALKDAGIGKDSFDLPMGKYLAIWNKIVGRKKDLIGFQAGINLWPIILEFDEKNLKIFSEAAKKAKKEFSRQAAKDLKTGKKVENVLLIKECSARQFESWHKRIKTDLSILRLVGKTLL